MRTFILILFLVFLQICDAIKWLGVHRIADNTIRSSNDCPKSREHRKLLGLSASHIKTCQRTVELMPLIIKASRETVSVCQTMFSGHRWNCSSLISVPVLHADLTKGTKEQAYVYALAAASLTQRVAQACASGELSNCPCGFGDTSAHTTITSNANILGMTNDIVDTYKWKGCSDNVMHGRRISREWTESIISRKALSYNGASKSSNSKFLNGSDNDEAIEYTNRRKKALKQRYSMKRRYLAPADITADEVQRYFMDDEMNKNFHNDAIVGQKTKMNQHNSDVGRHVTEQSLYRKCKCHGVSSSCEVKTCWYTLPPLHVIAERLKERYVTAQMVRPNERVGFYDSHMPRNDMRMLRNTESAKQLLVYIKSSADYCEENKELGSYGTQMRECNLTSSGPDSCESLCCGRGFNTQQVHVEEQCECKYVHCCYVKCKTCIYDVDKYFCK